MNDYDECSHVRGLIYLDVYYYCLNITDINFNTKYLNQF